MKITMPDGTTAVPDELVSTRVMLIARVGRTVVWSDGPRQDAETFDTEVQARDSFARGMLEEGQGILEELQETG